MKDHPQDYMLENLRFDNLGFPDILQQSAEGIFAYKRGAIDIQPTHIELNAGAFSVPNAYAEYPTVAVVQTATSLVVTCPCRTVETNALQTPKRSFVSHFGSPCTSNIL
jgi:hypothetical protein